MSGASRYMTLDEWIELSPDDRNAHRWRWERDGGDWMELISEARARFDSLFRSHPLINRISEGGWPAAGNEPCILVTTALYAPQLIEDLPDRFCTFHVVQEQVLDNRDYYLRYWTLLFNELLGWSEDQTREWALKWDDDLNGRIDSMIYHEAPHYYALPLVIRASLPTGVTETYPEMPLYMGVLRAIHTHVSEPIWLSPHDWNSARERVNEFLSAVGGRLPR